MRKVIVFDETVKVQHQVFLSDKVSEEDLEYFWSETSGCETMDEVYEMIERRVGIENFLSINENFYEDVDDIEYCEDYDIDDSGKRVEKEFELWD